MSQNNIRICGHVTILYFWYLHGGIDMVNAEQMYVDGILTQDTLLDVMKELDFLHGYTEYDEILKHLMMNKKKCIEIVEQAKMDAMVGWMEEFVDYRLEINNVPIGLRKYLPNV